MAWTAPMTAVANTAFTAAQFNTHVRDNLLMTAPGTATVGINDGSILTKNGTNNTAWRYPNVAVVGTTQTTSSTSFTNLATAGPAVTVTTSTRALVIVSAEISNGSNNSTFMSFQVSGATSLAADDSRSFRYRDSTTNAEQYQGSRAVFLTSLNAGSNTFTAKYRVIGGTGTYSYREINVIPF